MLHTNDGGQTLGCTGLNKWQEEYHFELRLQGWPQGVEPRLQELPSWLNPRRYPVHLNSFRDQGKGKGGGGQKRRRNDGKGKGGGGGGGGGRKGKGGGGDSDRGAKRRRGGEEKEKVVDSSSLDAGLDGYFDKSKSKGDTAE